MMDSRLIFLHFDILLWGDGGKKDTRVIGFASFESRMVAQENPRYSFIATFALRRNVRLRRINVSEELPKKNL